MPFRESVIGLVLAIGLSAAAHPGEPPSHADFRIRLFEVQPGGMSSEQTCTLVFSDRHFYHEKAVFRRGHDHDRKIYEGELSDSEWSALGDIVDSQEFRGLRVQKDLDTLVISDSHPYSITVARGNTFQTLDFLDARSLKPYWPQISPLLKWWKALRGRHLTESGAAADERCSPDRSHPVISN